jgi:hypothetical protein
VSARKPDDRIVTYPENVVHLVDVLLEAGILTGSLSRSSESETATRTGTAGEKSCQARGDARIGMIR